MRIKNLKHLFQPSPELVKAVQERAEQESIERGIPIERICVVALPWGTMQVVVLDNPARSG